MSILSELKPNQGSKHYPKRLGRGRGSGLGQTAGKGHKGQLARTGGKVRRGFEGGQSPLIRRLPKFGFSNEQFATKVEVVTLKSLVMCNGEVTHEVLKGMGLISGQAKVKIIGKEKLTRKLDVKSNSFSKGAKESIEASGGSVEVIK
jgi:large subunit ribosomal protein L15